MTASRAPNSTLARRLSLIVIADAAFAGGVDLVQRVSVALRAGAPAVQLRVKGGSGRAEYEFAMKLREETRSHGALFFINDRVDVALACGADGAHLGDDDLPLAAARRIVPPAFLLGRSAGDVATARTAQREGADYLGVGAVFRTGSKADAGSPIGLRGLRQVVEEVTIPVVGIGGIDVENATAVRDSGAAGVAVIRAVLGAADPGAAVRQLLRERPAHS